MEGLGAEIGKRLIFLGIVLGAGGVGLGILLALTIAWLIRHLTVLWA